MIEFIRPTYRPATVRPHPRAATVTSVPARFADSIAPPDDTVVFEHGPPLSPEDIMVLAQDIEEAADSPPAATVPATVDLPALLAPDETLPSPYLDEFMQHPPVNGGTFDRRE